MAQIEDCNKKLTVEAQDFKTQLEESKKQLKLEGDKHAKEKKKIQDNLNVQTDEKAILKTEVAKQKTTIADLQKKHKAQTNKCKQLETAISQYLLCVLQRVHKEKTGKDWDKNLNKFALNLCLDNKKDIEIMTELGYFRLPNFSKLEIS
mmetsp:Transcript_33395/g.38350  ORF Transcript_33395/g.38350 Transcript_33395/m.38350 type:complete len:149 (+) Transcript_33395:895-1341(+)